MELLITGIVIYIIYSSWKAYTHPSHTLGRQAANMNWIASGWIKDVNGHRNVRLKRNEIVVEIIYKDGNVRLIDPEHLEPFKDFIVLEHWLASHLEEIDGKIVSPTANHKVSTPRVNIPEYSPDIYFEPRPEHEIWKSVTHDNYWLIQSWFEDLCDKASLDNYENTNDLPDDILVIISDASIPIQEKVSVSHALLIILVHQYVDADIIYRQMYKKHWLAKMVSEANFAPPINSYTKFVNATYFNNAF